MHTAQTLTKLAKHTHKPWRLALRSSLSDLRGPDSLPTSDDKPCVRMMRFLLDRGCATIRFDVSTGFWVDLPFIAANVAQAMMRMSSATRTSATNSQHTARVAGTKKRQEQTSMKESGKARRKRARYGHAPLRTASDYLFATHALWS